MNRDTRRRVANEHNFKKGRPSSRVGVTKPTVAARKAKRRKKKT